MNKKENKTNPGNFFEDFSVGQEIIHSTPRTITSGDVSLFIGLLGSRFVLHSSEEFAKKIGYPNSPIDDILTFNMVFGKTVPDISLNSPANLGYASCKFGVPVYVGDTIKAKLKCSFCEWGQLVHGQNLNILENGLFCHTSVRVV